MTRPHAASGCPVRPVITRWLVLVWVACGACASGRNAIPYERFLVTANSPIPLLTSLPADGSLVPAGRIENQLPAVATFGWVSGRWKQIVKRAQAEQCSALLFDRHRIIIINFDDDQAESGLLFLLYNTAPTFIGVRTVCLKPPGAAASPAGPAS
jgi:hypothetical protein